jgi:hypothetical protein
MIGDRLDGIARRIVREETYDTIVAPSIADLQFEATHGRRARLRGYVAVWRMLAAALFEDVGEDARDVLTRRSIGNAAVLGVLTTAIVIAGHLSVFSWNWGFKPQDHWRLFLLLLPAVWISAWPTTMVPIAAALGRANRRGSFRVVLLASAVAAMLMLVAIDLAVTETNQRFREISFKENGGTGQIARGTRERTSWSLSRDHVRESRIEMHFRLAMCATTVGWALLGFGLRRARDATIVLAGVLAYVLVLAPISLIIFGIRGYQLATWAPWIPTGVVVMVGAVVARLASRPGICERANP